MNYSTYNERDIQSFEYETTIESNHKIFDVCELGKATIQLINDNNNYSSYKGTWINTIHGSFYIYDVKPVQERVNIKLECYDIKYKLEKKYDSSKHTFPCTLKEWRNSIFEDSEVVYDNSDFPFSDLVLTKEPYIGKNPTNRTVIAKIARAGLSSVTTIKDKFFFSWFSDTTHNVEDWLNLTSEKECSQPVNVVVMGRGDSEDNVKWPSTTPSNPKEFRIDNDYILDPQEQTDLRYERIGTIYNRLNGFSYMIFNLKTQKINNKLNIKLGEKVKYYDIWDNEITAYIMRKKITYLGGDLSNPDNYEITLSAEELKETSTELDYASSIENDVINVNRRADKLEGIIEDIITKTSDLTIESSSNSAYLRVEGIEDGEQFEIKIKPILEDIKFYLISSNHQVISNDKLNDRMLYITNQTTNEQYNFLLPADLLIYSDEIYDECIINQRTETCKIIKRVGFNTNGTKKALSSPITTTYPFKINQIKDGTYIIRLANYYSSGYIHLKTLRYATIKEVTTQLRLSAGEILGVVDELRGDVYTKAEVRQYVNGDDAEWRMELSRTRKYTVSNVDVVYGLSDSSTTPPTTWATVAPEWQNGKYMWQKTITTYLEEDATGHHITSESNPTCISGAQGSQGVQGETGSTGKGIKSIVEQYYLSTSSSNTSGDSWSNECPAWAIGRYIWTRSKVTWTDDSVTNTPAICATAVNQANEKTTKASIVATLNDMNQSTIKIIADVIDLDGVATFINTQLSTEGKTTINGSNITTGNIQSSNYVLNTSGTKISLVDGTIDSKNFKLSSDGKATVTNIIAKSGYIGNGSSGWTIGNTSIYNGCDSISSIKIGTYLGTDGFRSYTSADSVTTITGGKLTTNNAEITGGNIELKSEGTTNSKFKIIDNEDNTTQVWRNSRIEHWYKNGVERIQIHNGMNTPLIAVGNAAALGSVYTITPTGGSTSSDITLKENISTIDENESMNFITNLNPIIYTFKKQKKYHRGLSAQEVEKVLNDNNITEQVYSIDDNGYYSINYSEMIPDLINCIKYLKSKMEVLENG